MVVGSSRSPPPGKNGKEENIYHNIYFGILVYLLISTEFLQRNKRTKIIIIRHFLPHFPCFLLGDFSFTYHFGVCVCERVSVRESFVRTFLSSLIKLMGTKSNRISLGFGQEHEKIDSHPLKKRWIGNKKNGISNKPFAAISRDRPTI